MLVLKQPLILSFLCHKSAAIGQIDFLYLFVAQFFLSGLVRISGY